MTQTKPKGHAAHMQAADEQRGLRGEMLQPIKITLLGAGSAFTPVLLNDVLRIPGADRGVIALVDIDRRRLQTMHKVITQLVAQLGKSDGWQVIASANRREVMKGSHYITNCIEVSGVECVRYDNDIPLKYGIDQCIGDTIGPGGLFKALRTIPVWLEVLQDAERLCPDALVLNYTNPMSMLCLSANRTSSMPVVGLCHSVQGTTHLLAKRAGVPYDECEWECAGINHLAWITKFEHKGRDLYPLLKRKAAADIARALKEGRIRQKPTANRGYEAPEWHRDLVRKDMMLHFGAFITESSGHLSEYLPYYRKRPEILNAYCREGYDGGSRFYASNWPKWRKLTDQHRMRMLAGKAKLDRPRSWEYASWIIEAREKDVPFRIHGNVANRHRSGGPLISNLPHDGCVEVACMVDRNGINPTVYGALPPQMAALCASHMYFHELGVTAAIERSREAAIHALMLDPLTAAVCSPAQIKKMTLELFAAEKRFLPGYK
jgi:alpha-galactosidase